MQSEQIYDFVIIGSGFGGSASAMRLVEKGYTVAVLERGRRYRDEDFPKSNWNLRQSLWMPALRAFGMMQFSLLNGVMALRWSGVGGGSLGYANVLMEPSDELFNNPTWKHLADWKQVLRPHYDTAKRMLGVARNPHITLADEILKDIAESLGTEETFESTDVGVFFGEPNVTVDDPFFGGDGPSRTGCTQCGGCMVGCRFNAKNTLLKNYLYFAEKWGTHVFPERTVTDIRPLVDDQSDGARYEVFTRKTRRLLRGGVHNFRARHVIISAGVLGTLKLLFRCRDETKSLPKISHRLGEQVRTNSEAILGSTSYDKEKNFSEGIAITSIIKADDVTHIEPVRYSERSGFIRGLAVPLITVGSAGVLKRLLATLAQMVIHPRDFLHLKFFGQWAKRTTIILVMQTEDTLMKISPGRNIYTGFLKGLVARRDDNKPIETEIPIGHHVTREFSRLTRGVPQASFNESMLNIPTTAHILGGVPMGHNAEDGVIGLNCEVHGYPGLYIVDGSIMPANPGINPTLTITALAEYAMSQIPDKEGAEVRKPLMVET